jgi:hypothetical protein
MRFSFPAGEQRWQINLSDEVSSEPPFARFQADTVPMIRGEIRHNTQVILELARNGKSQIRYFGEIEVTARDEATFKRTLPSRAANAILGNLREARSDLCG